MAVNERLRTLTFNAFEWMTPKGYRLEVVNEEYLRVLQQQPKSPTVLFFNHSKQDDIFLAFHLINEYARQRLDNIIIPVSESYIHYKNYTKYAFFVDLGRKVARFKLPEVVQSYRLRREGGDAVSLKNLQIKSSNLGRQFSKFLDQELPGGPVIFVSPEGHRSKFLLPAEAGVGHIAKKMNRLKRKGEIDDGYFIPLAIEFEDNEDPDLRYNFMKRPGLKLSLGKPIDLVNLFSEVEEISERRRPSAGLISHYLMAILSDLLPASKQGVYQPKILQDTLAGRFEQHIRDSGRVVIYDKWGKEFFDIDEITGHDILDK